MADLYAPGGHIGTNVGLLPQYDILLRMFRHTIAPSAGNNDEIHGGLVNLMIFAHYVYMSMDDDTEAGSRPIDVMDFIFQEMHYAVFHRKTPPYAPYVMKLIKFKYPLSPHEALDVDRALDCEEHKSVKLNKKNHHVIQQQATMDDIDEDIVAGGTSRKPRNPRVKQPSERVRP